MRYAILGGDMRFAHLTSMLNESGRQACAFLQEEAGGGEPDLRELPKYDCIISNWPMRWPLSRMETTEAEIMEHVAPGSVLLLCGPKFPQDRRWDLQYINLWADEDLLRENAWLTAEGAVASAMQHSSATLRGMDCMVVGYGRIGRALTELLLNMGARVTVVSGKETKRRQAMDSGANAMGLDALADALPGVKCIFSTPPAMVIGGEALNRAAADAVIIDLASPPYGVDLDAAQERGLRAWREPGLPGRYCPLSAARAIYNAVLRWEEGEVHEN